MEIAMIILMFIPHVNTLSVAMMRKKKRSSVSLEDDPVSRDVPSKLQDIIVWNAFHLY